MCQMLIQRNLRDVFPNVEVLLRIHLTFIISNCCGKRYFSKLKMIKDANRSTMSQNRLVHLLMLSTEWDILRQINLDQILSDFRAAKMRKQFISL